MDLIVLRGIRVDGKHGAYAEEREREQPFDIDLELELDLERAAHSDDLADTVNYASVRDTVARVVRGHSFQLLERLADAILYEVFADARIRGARVSIAKPEILDGATPVVILRRTNTRHPACP